MINYNNFIKWLVLKAFIKNEVSNATKIAIIFVFLYEIYFILVHIYFKCNLKNPKWYQRKQEGTIYSERFSLRITNNPCNKGLKYCKFTRKRNKAKHVMKNDHSKR